MVKRLGMRGGPKRTSHEQLPPAPPASQRTGKRRPPVPAMSQSVHILSDDAVQDIVRQASRYGTGALVTVNWKNPDEDEWTTWFGQVVVFKRKRGTDDIAAVVDWSDPADEARGEIPRNDIDYGEIVFDPAPPPEEEDDEEEEEGDEAHQDGADVEGDGGGGEPRRASVTTAAPPPPPAAAHRASTPSGTLSESALRAKKARDARKSSRPDVAVGSPRERFCGAQEAMVAFRDRRQSVDQADSPSSAAVLNAVHALGADLREGISSLNANVSALVSLMRAAPPPQPAGAVADWQQPHAATAASTTLPGSPAGSRSPTISFPPPPPPTTSKRQQREASTPARASATGRATVAHTSAAVPLMLKRVTPFTQCPGCECFECIFNFEKTGPVSLKREAESVLINPEDHRKDIVLWMVGHGLGLDPPDRCDHIRNTGVQCRNERFTLLEKARSMRWRCTHGACRKLFDVFPHYWNPVGYLQFLLLYVGAGVPVARAKTDEKCDLGHDAVAAAIQGLCETAMLFNADALFFKSARWTNMQWDETFVSWGST